MYEKIPGIRMPEGEHPFDGERTLNKNKNNNKNILLD
jgi:hypothetical protein